jgi:small subunit ribosomal protein S8e
MGIVRSRLHKRKVSGGKTKIHRKKRRHEMGRLPANTKLGARRVKTIRTRGGNNKQRALRLDTGNFAWGTESASARCRILDVVYNATSNELVRTKTLVKNAIVSVDATPFKVWYAKHYGIDMDAAKKKGSKKALADKKKKKKGAQKESTIDVNKASAALKRKWAFRRKGHTIEKAVEDQFKLGRFLAKLSTRPGQTGRADGVLLEGAELQFYMKKLEKKAKK